MTQFPINTLILSPDLIILNASKILNAVQAKRENLIGRFIFDAFTQNQNLSVDDGMTNVNASLQYWK